MEIPKQYAGIDEEMFLEMNEIDADENEDWEEEYSEELKEFTKDTELWETQRFINDNEKEIEEVIKLYIGIKAVATSEGR